MSVGLQILYEDNHLLAVYKPAGLLSQGDRTGDITALDRVTIAPSGSVDGDITAPRISIADGARFKGKIDMEGPGSSPRAGSTQPAKQAFEATKTVRTSGINHRRVVAVTDQTHVTKNVQVTRCVEILIGSADAQNDRNTIQTWIEADFNGRSARVRKTERFPK